MRKHLGAAVAALLIAAAGALVPLALAGGSNEVHVEGRGWTCTTAVDLDLVEVRNPSGTGIIFGNGCTGRIGRIEISGARGDGAKTFSDSHDLIVGGGFIRCVQRSDPDLHQDGLQIQGGHNVQFRGLTIDCRTANNAAMHFGASRENMNDVVCDGCTFLPANSTVNMKAGFRSGIRNSTVCQGSTAGIRIQSGMIEPVNVNNRVLSRSNAVCQGTAEPPPVTEPGTTLPPPTTTEPPPAGCDAACVSALRAENASLTAQLEEAQQAIRDQATLIARYIDAVTMADSILRPLIP
jgi:hypothetical protein